MKAGLLKTGMVVLALCAMASVAVAEDSEQRIFVKKIGDGGEWHGDGNVFVHGEGEGFNLSELLDGETRTFGEGDHQVTATRAGDIVTIQKSRVDDENLEFTCNVTTDTCKVIEADGQRTMVWVQKERTCESGEGDCEMMFVEHGNMVHAGAGLHDLANVTVTTGADCEGDDCPTMDVIVKRIGGGEAMASGHGNVFIAEGGHVMRMDSNKRSLRCPEGDTTMRVDKEEVDEVFLCPKHSVPLEEVKMRTRVVPHIEVREAPHQH